MFNFIIDIVDAIIDIWETWREKDEKILSKLICTIMTLGFLIISAKIWL
ncbi:MULTISPECIES: hypothetical protein [Clostridia]|nr:hypothetical protein [Clostridium sp. CCUG 7971]MBO3443715.1 hypothetical protein [Clostridium sp. CCUG 7971]